MVGLHANLFVWYVSDEENKSYSIDSNSQCFKTLFFVTDEEAKLSSLV